MGTAIDLYHRLPPVSRSVVASLRGYYLNWWRYDASTDDLVERILERDSWTADQWKEWQNERLSFILERAATRVPYYRQLWSQRRRDGDKSSWAYLENWRILEKEDLRSAPLSFVADDCRPSKMFRDHTSGTTGTSLDLWSSKQTVRQWYAIFEARSRRWYGLSRKDRWAILGGQIVTPAKQRKPPYWVWNAGLNQLYLSSYHLSPTMIPAYLDALLRHRVRYLLGYPSAIYALAREALAIGRKDISFDVVITNAEPIYQYQRDTISAAFSCPVRETYGMAEIAAAASECEFGSLHQWPDTGIIETESSDPASEPSDLICTGLINPDMPMIRYRVGDSGVLSADNCSCGRELPVIERIDGRSDDVLITSDGRRIGRLDPVFKGDLSIREAQIIQESIGSLTVRYVPSENFSQQTLIILRERLVERMGPIEIVFDEVDQVPRTSRGKFRAVICKIPNDQRPDRHY